MRSVILGFEILVHYSEAVLRRLNYISPITIPKLPLLLIFSKATNW